MPRITRQSAITGVLAFIATVAIATIALRALVTIDDVDELFSDTVAVATDGQRFSIVDYELSHLPNRWLGAAARFFGAQDMPEVEALQRWFDDADPSARASAQWHLERRVQEAAAGLGLDTSLPLFGGARIVWPPVDVDISAPLAIIAVSRRDEVRLLGAVLLQALPDADEVAAMEARMEASGEYSAYVTTVSGVALYPAQIIEGRDHASTLDIVAHEWVHHYLAFHPLGYNYARSADLRTLNETVADIAGDEIAAAAVGATPFQQAIDREAAQRWDDIRSQTDPILRQLRIDVDALLIDGRVDEAEALMAERRLELLGVGRPFRRINQAFLAFRGSYGASPASATEWGPRLFALRDQSASLREFMQDVRGIGSYDEADELLPPP